MSLCIHCNTNVGQSDSGIEVAQKTDGAGQDYWEAKTTVTHLFGQELTGSAPIIGIGKTREIAIARCKQELKEFNDSLWAE